MSCRRCLYAVAEEGAANAIYLPDGVVILVARIVEHKPVAVVIFGLEFERHVLPEFHSEYASAAEYRAEYAAAVAFRYSDRYRRES